MAEVEYPRVIFRSGEHLDNALAERCDGTSASKSAVAKRDLQRYYSALEANTPAFTMQEALLLCECLNGARCSPGTLYANIATSDVLVSDKWDVDKPVLLERIKQLTYIQPQSVIDTVERAWNAPEYSIDLTKRVLLVGLAK